MSNKLKKMDEISKAMLNASQRKQESILLGEMESDRDKSVFFKFSTGEDCI